MNSEAMNSRSDERSTARPSPPREKGVRPSPVAQRTLGSAFVSRALSEARTFNLKLPSLALCTHHLSQVNNSAVTQLTSPNIELIAAIAV